MEDRAVPFKNHFPPEFCGGELFKLGSRDHRESGKMSEALLGIRGKELETVGLQAWVSFT